MHSNSTAIHNGARPNALNIANAVDINRSANGRYSSSMGPYFLEVSTGAQCVQEH